VSERQRESLCWQHLANGYAYDRKADLGRLDKGLDEAPRRGWTVVSMKNDWRIIFPPKK
jgi:hypothetical protein